MVNQRNQGGNQCKVTHRLSKSYNNVNQTLQHVGVGKHKY